MMTLFYPLGQCPSMTPFENLGILQSQGTAAHGNNNSVAHQPVCRATRPCAHGHNEIAHSEELCATALASAKCLSSAGPVAFPGAVLRTDANSSVSMNSVTPGQAPVREITLAEHPCPDISS